MKANICQVCGGKLKNFGTYFRCENCDTEYRIDESLSQDDMDAYFRRLNDFEDAERNLDVMPPRFDEAESEFERIIRKYPDWSAGYWGLVRSKFGIKFEIDLDGKAVPSCYKSTYEDFCDTDEYNMAIELAETEELRQSYIKWAEYIARVAKEWRQTAQKYDYDVFISFKASEDSDGHETRDAREMHKLYDLIRDKGYRVFFSPVTLVAEGVAGKGSEPYIFNALDKSRALIVYGSKKEYFTSTWVQNEWQRYLRFIKEGKKEKGSLLVLYQGFNPKELPQGLRRIQGIEYGISAWPAISSALEQILNKGNNEKAVAEEAARKAEEKRKAEEESANKLQDMLAQFAQMQAELARLKSATIAVQPSASPVMSATSHNIEASKTSDTPILPSKPKTAEPKDAVEQYNLGVLYDEGRDVKQDYSKAAYWYGKAAEQGYASAQFNLGTLYYNGQGVEQDYSKAVHWFEKAAEQRDIKAQYILGTLYDKGQGVEQDYTKAVYWYSKAAQQGNAKAQYNLGALYAEGQGVSMDYSKAIYWYEKAAEQGDADAQNNLGICYANGQGVLKDYSKAAYWYGKAAEHGDSYAQNNLGFCYANGQGVAQDYSKAIYWYKRAVKQGNAAAQLNLGVCYANGQGVIQDYSKAVNWYNKAANQGNAKAQYNLAFCYEHGLGVKQDYAKAVFWYRKAAVQGNVEAQNNLGVCFYNGRGVELDYSKAVYWYSIAAELGSAMAQHNLGFCYEHGLGVTKNLEKAKELYQKVRGK